MSPTRVTVPMFGRIDSQSPTNQRLATAYEGLFRAFVKHKSVKIVTFWGPNDANSWRAQGRPLLFDRDSQPKPAYNAVIRVATGQQTKLQ